MSILAVSNVSKSFGEQKALDNISLSISSGERVALLGHNGAGKSTLMKIILGLMPFNAGSVEIDGQMPGSKAARAITAYLPENVAFHPSLTGREQLRHFLRLRSRSVNETDELLSRVGLRDAANRRIGTYSKGMRQRVGLAQALIGAPKLMILDEPTSGLDPVSRAEFYTLLDDLASKGTAILLSSHALSELETRTDRVFILSSGNLVAEGALADLRREASLPYSVVLYPKSGAMEDLLGKFPEANMEAGNLLISAKPEDRLALLERITYAQDLIEDFDIQASSLDDLYSHISQRVA